MFGVRCGMVLGENVSCCTPVSADCRVPLRMPVWLVLFGVSIYRVRFVVSYRSPWAWRGTAPVRSQGLILACVMCEL